MKYDYTYNSVVIKKHTLTSTYLKNSFDFIIESPYEKNKEENRNRKYNVRIIKNKKIITQNSKRLRNYLQIVKRSSGLSMRME